MSLQKQGTRYFTVLVQYQHKGLTRRHLETLQNIGWTITDLSDKLMLFQKEWSESYIIKDWKAMIKEAASFSLMGPLSFTFSFSLLYKNCSSGRAWTGENRIYRTCYMTFGAKTPLSDLMLKWLAADDWNVITVTDNSFIAQKAYNGSNSGHYDSAFRRWAVFSFSSPRCTFSNQEKVGQFQAKIWLKNMKYPGSRKLENLAHIDLRNSFPTNNVELDCHKTMTPMCGLKNGEFLPPDMVQTRFWRGGKQVTRPKGKKNKGETIIYIQRLVHRSRTMIVGKFAQKLDQSVA